MKASDLAGFFLRSLFIMASLNFRRMQNLGFAFAILPLARRMGKDKKSISSFLARHLEYFNTHPYLSGAILGSVIRLEAANGHHDQTSDISRLKKTLMGPYAAIGDSFFWGSLRPLAGITAAAIAYQGSVWGPFVLLLIFDPLQLWIRLKSFLEGYRHGWQGITYIQSWDLPRLARFIRWGTIFCLALAAACLGQGIANAHLEIWMQPLVSITVLTAVLLSFLAMERGMSPLTVLYGMTAGCVALMI
ncbi:MAG: PTS system mannose/fructose/sorbose family transporter subunit IID [Syntrophales bacterium]|jgi:PTS system mannose-specific IID component|nr:PTS system mannose/fructose/sorbose family transporter subunit IID [Syntrophales bacterium]